MKWSTLRRKVLPLVSYAINRLPGEHVERMLTERAAKTGRSQFYFEYPFDSRPRWTEANPHPQILRILDTGLERYKTSLKQFNALIPQLKKIPLAQPSVPIEAISPRWNNGWLPALDAVSLYAFTALGKPRQYLEVGSGNSTKFVRRAVDDFQLSTRIVSIDPAPRAEVDDLCDKVIRQGLEETDLSPFEALGPGDIVFIDNSHRSLMNSDVTVFFMDVLPRLRSGVLVGIHDIFWPLDYPSDWASRYYSEQYLLGQLLLWKEDLQIELPGFHVSVSPRQSLMSLLDPLWQELPSTLERFGASFWFTWKNIGRAD